jgi:hypothetical protein
MRDVSNKRHRKNQNTHFIFSNFFPENRTFYEITWKNTVESEAADGNMAVRFMLDY